MIKILLLLLLAFFLVTLLWAAAFNAFYQAALDTYQPKASANPTVKPPESMVACFHCGTYVPASESIRQSNRTYCCQDHVEQARKRQQT